MLREDKDLSQVIHKLNILEFKYYLIFWSKSNQNESCDIEEKQKPFLKCNKISFNNCM